MNRLDRHVEFIRNKLALERFFLSLGYAITIFLVVGLALVLIDRFLWVDLPRTRLWIGAGIAAVFGAAVVDAIMRRPTPHQAAMLIDAKLGLNEKFSTALYARSQGNENDPFVMAAVTDAERTAQTVSLHRRFPISFPVSTYFALGAGVIVLMVARFLPRVDLFDHHAKQAAAQNQEANRIAAQQQAKNALAAVNSLPAAVQNQEKVELAKKDLQRVLDQPNADPTVTKLTASKAQEEAEAARQEQTNGNPAVSQAMADKAVFNSMNPSSDDHGLAADASREIANGEFAKAQDSLQELQKKFDQMTPQQQQAAVDQMNKTAEQLKKIASDPAAMQHLQQQLQKQGATTQQSQQMAAAAQQPQGQQKLQQVQKQISQQMNGGKGPKPQQQAQMQKTAQQMQAVANSQNKSQQMSKAAQQMAQGMQQSQANKQGGNKPGQQQANAKMADSQKAGPMQGGQTPSGKQGGTEQAQGSKPDGQAPGGQQPSSDIQQGGQQLAQALNEMDSTQKDAQQQSSGQGDKPGDSDTPGSKSTSLDPGPGKGGEGKFGHSGSKRSTGVGGPGDGGGQGQSAPRYTVKQEMDPSQNVSGGKVLAKSYVKVDQVIGKSTIQLSPAAQSAVKESTDDVSEDTVPKDAQKAVKDYFDTVQNGN